MSIQESKIAFIGGGNMAAAIVQGLLKQGHTEQSIVICEPDTKRAKWLKSSFNITVTDLAEVAVSFADAVVLAVKPQIILSVIEPLAQTDASAGKVFISIAAGTSVQTLASRLGQDTAIVRLMPNMPALVNAGMTGLYANEHTDDQQKEIAKWVAQACGALIELEDENQINAVTALSGSGPAYFLLMMQAMQEQGRSLGLSDQQIKALVTQTAIGAGQLAQASEYSPEELCQQIASKGGTTEAALDVLKRANVDGATRQAVKAAYNCSIELSGAK